MDNIKKVDVLYNGSKVGTLAEYDRYRTAFEYSDEWLNDGFSISPFSIPLEKRVFLAKASPFGGLFGVFNDSLPDGWGRLLVDRYLRSIGENPEAISNLTRLSIVGENGMGALEYIPKFDVSFENQTTDFDRISQECKMLLESNYSNDDDCDLDNLFLLGGSSGGARPKILTKIDGEEWIVKFASSQDDDDIGQMEYDYSICAGKCGIDVPKTRLFSSKICSGYFGTKRFDRDGEKKIHMVSVSGLLEISHRVPNLDYNTLMKLTLEITKDYDEVLKMYRLMCFNVFAHNRDDHSKNFSYLYDDSKEAWVLSPAYDLTYSNSMYGEHATMVNRNGKDPGLSDILEVAKLIGISTPKAKSIANEIREIVNTMLGKYIN